MEKRQNHEEISTLKFLLRVQAFEKHLEPKIFKNILKSHFDIENEVLALSNSSVSDYLCQRTSEISDLKMTEEDKKYLKRAKNDPTVTSEGLEPAYQKFLSETSASKLACLLTIL